MNVYTYGLNSNILSRRSSCPKGERFLGGREVDFRGSDFAYKPFGAGRRVCPGMDIATRFVPLVLASVLRKIEWRLPGGMAPEDVDLRDKYGTSLELATPLRGVPVPTV